MRELSIVVISLLFLSFGTIASAEIKSQTVEYTYDGQTFKGYLVYNDSWQDKRPGVLLVHEWWGVNDYIKTRAKQIAERDYVAFALDMYGEGKVTTDPKEAAAWSGEVKGSSLIRKRAQAGLDELLKNKYVDSSKVAAMGYCFGGTTVLELANSGADIQGVLSFHGHLPLPQANDTIKAKILVMHGADDPYVPIKDVLAYQDSLRKAGADWQMVFYGNAVHSFTNSSLDSDNSKGAAYNKKADYRSWQHAIDFFDEMFMP